MATQIIFDEKITGWLKNYMLQDKGKVREYNFLSYCAERSKDSDRLLHYLIENLELNVNVQILKGGFAVRLDCTKFSLVSLKYILNKTSYNPSEVWFSDLATLNLRERALIYTPLSAMFMDCLMKKRKVPIQSRKGPIPYLTIKYLLMHPKTKFKLKDFKKSPCTRTVLDIIYQCMKARTEESDSKELNSLNQFWDIITEKGGEFKMFLTAFGYPPEKPQKAIPHSQQSSINNKFLWC